MNIGELYLSEWDFHRGLFQLKHATRARNLVLIILSNIEVSEMEW